MNNKKPSVEELLENLKGDYRYPAQLWLWGKAISEWAGLIIVGGVFLCIFLVIISSMFTSKKVQELPIAQPTAKEEKLTAEQVLIPHIKDITKFMEINMNSLNERQGVLKKLLEVTSFYSHKELTQANLEQKVDILSNLLTHCNARRGSFIKELSEISNPFETPEIYKNFKELITARESIFENRIKTTSSQEENQQWRDLCAFCENEARKSQQELVHLLNPK